MRDAADQKRVVDLADKEEKGLHLFVTPKGATTWRSVVRDQAGTQKKPELGTYPETGIKAARKAHRDRRAGEHIRCNLPTSASTS